MDISEESEVISVTDNSNNLVQSSGSVISISAESSIQGTDKTQPSLISLTSTDNKDSLNLNDSNQQHTETTDTESRIDYQSLVVDSEYSELTKTDQKENLSDSKQVFESSVSETYSDPIISSFDSKEKDNGNLGENANSLKQENKQVAADNKYSSSGNIDIEEDSSVHRGSSGCINNIQTDSESVEPHNKRQRTDEGIESTRENNVMLDQTEKESHVDIDTTKGEAATNTVADVSHVSSMGSSVHEGEMAQPQESVWDNDFSTIPKFLCQGRTDFNSEKENFLKGCKWAPDGTCFVTNSEDNCLRVFNLPQQICQLELDSLPELTTALKIPEAELIYDYCWHPRMNPSDRTTCCLFSTSRDAPVHMWDAFTGELVSTYKSHNHADELSAAHSLALSPDGKLLYCGFNKMIRVFDINRPGKFCQKRPTLVSTSSGKKQKKKNSMKVGQSGIISCLDVNPVDHSMYAAGSYTRSIGLYTEPEGTMYCMFQGQAGGVTHLKFSPDGTKLYSGGRKDPELICWDVRNPGKILFILNRELTTNQRIYFDMDHTGQYVISGSQNGDVFVWDTLSPPSQDVDGEPVIQPLLKFKAHGDCANGLSLHPTMPLLVTASGQRHFNIPSRTIDSDSEDEAYTSNTFKDCPNPDSTVKLWWAGKKNVTSGV